MVSAEPSYTSTVPPQPPALLRKLTMVRPREPDPTGRRSVSVSRRIPAPAAAIFAILCDPRRHVELDGSGDIVTLLPDAPSRLGLGVQFAMQMHHGFPYRVRNTVVEFEEGRRIAWSHAGGHRWRYVLEPQPDGQTLVTETFDWSTAKLPAAIERMGIPERNLPGMRATLEHLERLVSAAGKG